jgi:hypothetical protein
MKPPNQKTCSISAMLEWAAAANGKVRKSRKATMIAWILANITELERIKVMPWASREWAMTALRDIDRIGVCESLGLLPPLCQKWENDRPLPINGYTSPISRLRSVCKALGLHLNKINGRTVITRQQLTLTSKQVMLSELPVDRRGESSPEFGLEIDLNAKPTQLCPSPN